MRLFQPSDIDARIMLIQQPGLKLILEQDNALARGISQDDIQKVRDATDIVALISERVPLKQRGHEFWGCCPFHHEKTPSSRSILLRNSGIASVAGKVAMFLATL